jgi:hypothetical protein
MRWRVGIETMIDDIRMFRYARKGTSLACLFSLMAASAVAQAPVSIKPQGESHEGTIIGGQPAASSFERCVDVQIGSDGAFGCLNQKLKREVEKINPTINMPPIDARSSDIRVGNVNEMAVRQQYGSNFGRSVIPYRPPAPVYVLPNR